MFFLMFKLSAILWPSRRLARRCLELHHGTFVSLSPCFSVITRLRRTELGQNSFSHKVHSVISTPTQSHGRNLKFGAAVYVPSLFQRRRGLDKDLGPSKRRQRRHRERQKSNRFRLAKQQLCSCIRLFCTFLSRYRTTTTWKCLISRFAEDVNARRRLSFSFPELRYSLLEFKFRKKLPTFHELNEME